MAPPVTPADGHAPVESRPDAFASFRLLVFAERDLEARLRATGDWPSFLVAAIDGAASHGLALTEADLVAARDAARRSWLERWI